MVVGEGEIEKDANGGGKEKGEGKHWGGKKKRKKEAPRVEHLTKGIGGLAFLFFSFNRILCSSPFKKFDPSNFSEWILTHLSSLYSISNTEIKLINYSFKRNMCKILLCNGSLKQISFEVRLSLLNLEIVIKVAYIG